MSKKPRPTSLVLPLVVITTLVNVPGMAGEGTRARLMFMLVGVLAWTAAEIYERRAELIVGTFTDIIARTFTAFFAKTMKRTRVCLFTTIAACTAYTITVGGYWSEGPPFPVAPLFIISFVWAFIELLGVTLNAFDLWSAKRQS